jgi:ABC-type uncharacterized transport system fused permease/ATPase subunit
MKLGETGTFSERSGKENPSSLSDCKYDWPVFQSINYSLYRLSFCDLFFNGVLSLANAADGNYWIGNLLGSFQAMVQQSETLLSYCSNNHDVQVLYQLRLKKKKRKKKNEKKDEEEKKKEKKKKKREKKKNKDEEEEKKKKK